MIIAFSSVQTDYFSRVDTMFAEPVAQVFALSETEYRRLAAGGFVSRLRLRFTMYCTYPLRVFWVASRTKRSDVLLVSSNTFFAPVVAWIGSRRARPPVVHWLYDLFPDALEVSGAIRPGGLRSRLAGLMQRRINASSSAVVYLGEFLRKHGDLRWGPAKKAFSIDIASDEGKFAEPERGSDGALVLHYGGQLGRMHDAESLAACVRAIAELKLPGLGFDFHISGAQRRKFADAIAENRLDVHGPIPSHEWRVLIQTFRIGLVSLTPGGATVCLPSKTYAMMAGGLAIVAICPAWSDLARLVRESNCGIVINNSPFSSVDELFGSEYEMRCNARRDVEAIAFDFSAAIRTLYSNRELLEEMRKNAARAARTRYGVESLRSSWAEVIAYCRSDAPASCR